MMGADRRYVVEEVWRAYERGGAEEALELCCDDVCWRPPDSDELLRGTGVIRERFAAMESEGEHMRAAIAAVDELRDGRLLVRGRLRREAPGRIADQDVWWLCGLRDGRLASVETHSSRPAVA